MSYFATNEGLVVMLFAKKVEAGVRVPNAKARSHFVFTSEKL